MKKIILLLIALMFVGTISNAQTIPNAGFEDWTSMGTYSNPNSWSCLNDVTSSMSTYTCVKGTPGNPGTGYLKITSKTVAGMGVVPGICVSGTIDQSTFQPLSGFPFTQRPANLTGRWQHMIYGTVQGYVDIQLTHWDGMSRVPIASAHYLLIGMAMAWSNFSIPLNYVSGNDPDSCMITLSASGSTPTNNDYLYADNLAFTGSVTGVSDIAGTKTISVYPNPVINNIIVDLSVVNNSKVDFQISDIQGKIVKSVKGIDATSKTSFDIADLQKGNYILKVTSASETFISHFVKE